VASHEALQGVRPEISNASEQLVIERGHNVPKTTTKRGVMMTKFDHLPDPKEFPRIHPHKTGIYLPGLRTARIISGLSQADLAREAHVGPTTVQQLERLRRGAYSKTIRKLSGALGVKPIDLMCPDPRTQMRSDDDHV